MQRKKHPELVSGGGLFLVSTPADERRSSLHGEWSSRLGFILAVAGSAVGLGNIWRFPYVAGENGGGAFVLVYLVCVFFIGLPIMMAEVLIGRRGRRNPVATMRLLGEEEAGVTYWRWVGVVGVATGFLILSFYSVIAGWTIAYIFEGGAGEFTGAGPDRINEIFSSLVSTPLLTGFWHTLFMLATVMVVVRGVEHGLERAVRVLVPALVALMLVLLGYSMVAGNFADGLRFLFEPRFDDLTGGSVLEALGQAFFTLSVGMGAVMAYGAYLPEKESIAKTTAAVVIADTCIAMLAALVIFPIVFANGMDPASGPGLVFQSLPLAFGQMPGGAVIAVLFFLLLTFAAWTSAISLMEPAVAYFMETRGWTRGRAATVVGGTIWALGFLTVLSFGPWSSLTFLRGTIFDNIDYLSNNVLLPLGGLAIVVFAGWIMAVNSTADELDPAAGRGYRLWRFSARYVAPVAVVLVLLNAVGLF
ncbi:MAG: sodium-dependent transporter [Gammaproteobacteria bacterium]|nr:sodium-dependent transporter [Gammaproteobacteria bacterium]